MSKTEIIVDKVKDNIIQLLQIGLYNTDENIKEVYGGEQGLLNLINGYWRLLDEFNLLMRYEKNEKTKIKTIKE